MHICTKNINTYHNICWLKFKGKELALGKLRVNVQLTICKYHHVLSKNIFQTVKSVFHFFPSCWHLSSSSNKPKSFFHSPGSVFPDNIFCPAARNVASPYCQLFPQPTHFPPSLLYNTLHLCNAFLSRLSKFFQIYYLISLLDNFITNTGIDKPKFVNELDSQKSFGLLVVWNQRQNTDFGFQHSLNVPPCMCNWSIVLHAWCYMDHLVCFMMVLQDYESECPTRDSGINIFLCWLPGNSLWKFCIQHHPVLISKPHHRRIWRRTDPGCWQDMEKECGSKKIVVSCRRFGARFLAYELLSSSSSSFNFKFPRVWTLWTIFTTNFLTVSMKVAHFLGTLWTRKQLCTFYLPIYPTKKYWR